MAFHRPYEAYEHWDSIDVTQFIRQFQRPHHNEPLERRGPLVVPEVMNKYVTSDTHSRNIALIAASRSQSTQGVYNRTLRKIEDFLTSRLESLLDLDQESLADYLYKQDKDQEKYSAVKNIKGSVCFLIVCLQLPNIWSGQIQKIYEGLYTRSSCERRLTMKAPYLPLTAYQQALRHHISDKLQDPKKIPFCVHRTALIQTLQFSLLARISDVQKLRACDVQDVELNGTPALAVTFRTQKNDPRFMGATSYIVKTGGPYCAYTVVKTYFSLYGFRMLTTECTDSSYIICRSKAAGKGKLRWYREVTGSKRTTRTGQGRVASTRSNFARSSPVYGSSTSPGSYDRALSSQMGCQRTLSSQTRCKRALSSQRTLSNQTRRKRALSSQTRCKKALSSQTRGKRTLSNQTRRKRALSSQTRCSYTDNRDTKFLFKMPVPTPDPKPGPPRPEPAPNPPPTPNPQPPTPPAA